MGNVTLDTSSTRLISTPHIRIRASQGWSCPNLSELWEYRELLYFLIWRDIKVRYKQTFIGAAWAILQPVVTTVILLVVFSKFAKIPSDGLPYPIFAFTALLPWNLFAGALNRSSGSVVGQSNLIAKVFFPRLIVPLSATFSGMVDFAISFGVLLAMMLWFGIAPTWAVLLLPLFTILALLTALSVGLWLAALNVRYRDIGHAVPLLVQLWMFASPVAYPQSLVPESWKFVYSLNPLVGVIEGFRWALLGIERPDFTAVSMSCAIVACLLVAGLYYFKRLEQTFADLV